MRASFLLLLAAAAAPAPIVAWPFGRGALTVQPGADGAKHDTYALGVCGRTLIASSKVALALGVMSKCPDARTCENVFDSVLDRVGNLVDLQMLYIGQLNSSDSRFGATCMHGESECLANVQQLCVRRHSDAQTAWRFIGCQNYGPLASVGREEDAKRCARLVGLDYEDELRPCIEGPRGASLLRASIRDAQFQHVKRSCSILIDNEIVCVHDGVWKNCDSGHSVADFVGAIRKAYARLNKD